MCFCAGRSIFSCATNDCARPATNFSRGFTALIHTLEPRYTLPSRKYFTDTVLTWIHKGIVSKVEEQIAKVDLFSFMTDIWSTEVSNYSMISLTTHWKTDHFEKKSAVLHVQSFPESHQHWKNNL